MQFNNYYVKAADDKSQSLTCGANIVATFQNFTEQSDVEFNEYKGEGGIIYSISSQDVMTKLIQKINTPDDKQTKESN